MKQTTLYHGLPEPTRAERDKAAVLWLSAAVDQLAALVAGGACLPPGAALLRPSSLVLLLSPTQRQSGELFRDKVLRLYDDLGQPVRATQQTALTLALANGSRVISLPGNEGASAATQACRCWSS